MEIQEWRWAWVDVSMFNPFVAGVADVQFLGSSLSRLLLDTELAGPMLNSKPYLPTSPHLVHCIMIYCSMS